MHALLLPIYTALNEPTPTPSSARPGATIFSKILHFSIAMKVQLIFLLAIVLHLSTRVTSLEEEIVTEGHHHQKKAPAYPPVKPPVHSPGKAPIYPPHKAPVHAPVEAPVHPPKKAPVQPPVKPPVYPPKNAPHHPPVKAPIFPPPAKSTHPHGNCISMCAFYCKSQHSKRLCLRICVPCCDKYKCVPGHSNSKGCSNSNWDEIMYHGQMVKCPKY